MIRTAYAAVALLTLGACTVGQQTSPPTIATPSSWTTNPPTSFGRADNETPWWSHFNDTILTRLVESTLAANGDVAAAQARVREARAARRGAAADRLPRIDAGADAGRRFENENARPVNVAQAQIEAGWEADLFGANRSTLEAQEALLGVSAAEADGVAQALAAETVRAYIDLREAQRRLAVARANLAAQQDTSSLTQTRQAAGLASMLDVSQAQSLLLSTQSALPVLEGRVRAAIRRLEALSAAMPGTLDETLQTASDVPRAALPAIVETPAGIIAQRPDLRAAERRLAASAASRRVAEAAKYPSLTLRALFGVREASPETFVLPSQALWSLAGGLTAPLFDAGRIQASIDAADARVEVAAAQYRQDVANAFGEVEAALSSLVSTENERIALMRAAVSTAETEALAQERYRRGLVAFIAVLDAQRASFQAQDRLAESEADAARRVIALHTALGSPAPLRSHAL
jgi:NodT family efflux transporter outer membrane factor (OMF) lipoprotein